MDLVIGLVIGLAGGGAATFVMLNVVLKSKREQVIREAELEAENIKKDKINPRKTFFLKILKSKRMMKK